jgi:molybdopterin-containing oxidoreductase family membrane subunit
VALCCVFIAWGVSSFVRQTEVGFIATALRSPGQGGAAWGLYVAFDVVFVGISFAGITVAAIARLFRVEALEPVTRIAELLTITALLAGGCVIMADLGRPGVGLVHLPEFANPHSPFFGTFTLVIAGYLFSSLVFFFLSGRADAAALASSDPKGPLARFHRLWASGYRDTDAERRRHRRVTFILALTILPLLITAHSTLGFIFGIQVGRPGWYGSLQAPAFVVMAGVSGTGVLILLIVGLRKLFGLPIPDGAIRWLGNFMWILGAVYLYFMAADELTAGYAAPEAERHVAEELTGGRFAPLFWTTVVSLLLAVLIPFVLYLRRKTAVGWVAAAAALANVAAVLKRFLIVVPSQIEGALLPVERATYTPSRIEVGIVTGLVAFVLLLILVFARVFPLVPGSHASHGPQSLPPPRDGVRVIVTAAWALASAAAIVLGLADSFRLFSHGEVDPRIPFSPVIFATGVMALFTSAAVYEIFPSRGARRGV